MATAIAEQPVLGAYVKEGATQFSTLTMTAGDAANMNSIVMGTGRCLVIFQNADVSNPEWVTVDASDDPYGRAVDINQQSLAAASWAAFVFEPRGWEQTLGGRDLAITCSNAEVVIAAIAL